MKIYLKENIPEDLMPYFVRAEIGLEPTLQEHIDVLVNVFREVRRILKPRGTVWLNYGDCYAAAPNGKSAASYKADGSDDRTFRDKPFSTVGLISEDGSKGRLKPKDLCMIPNRLAIALQDDGWWVRSEIIWHKPNPMPESVYDRPTVSHEKIWLLTKSENYFYDDEAIREPTTGGAHARKPEKNSRENVDRGPVSKKKSTGVGWGHQDRVNAGEVDRGRDRIIKEAGASEVFRKSNSRFHKSTGDLVDTRNSRNVWSIAPRAFKGAHFATFPPALAERCILAGVPKTICGCCGAADGCGPICDLYERVPGTVFDPFGGAGTVSLVAERLGLRSIMVELKEEYADIAVARIADDLKPIEPKKRKK